MLWHYRYGKPPSVIEIETPKEEDLANLSTEELAERARAIAEDMAEIQALTAMVAEAKAEGNVN